MVLAPNQVDMNPQQADIAGTLLAFDPASSAATLPTIVAIGLACGLLLWLLGSKVLRPAAAVLGGAIGSAVGVIAPTTLGIIEIAGVPASLFGLGTGAVLGMLMALALYRAVLTFSTGLVFGAAGLMTSLAVFTPTGPVAPEPTATDPVATVFDGRAYLEAAAITVWQDNVETGEVTPNDGLSEPTLEQRAMDRAMAFVRTTGSAIQRHWASLSDESKLIVLGSTLGALMFGLILGLAAPERASAVVTAALGSGLWLYCFAWLSVSESAPWVDSLDLGARGWAVVWAVTAMIGTGSQLLLWSRKHKPKVPVEAGAH